MSNSDSSVQVIDWDHEATRPMSSNWADEMDDDEPIMYTNDDSQPSEGLSSPLNSSVSSLSMSSSDGEEDKSTTNDKSPQTESFGDRTHRSDSHTIPRSGSHQRLSKYSNDSNSPSKPSVKEQIPFPTVAPFVAFVTNVHLDATQKDISQSFEPITGTPKCIKIILNKVTGLPRGFCYVEFADAAGLQAAIDADGMTFMTQPLHIVVADQKKEAKTKAPKSRKIDNRDHQDSNRGRHTRQDSFSMKKNDSKPSWKTSKDSFKMQNGRSDYNRSFDKAPVALRTSSDAYRPPMKRDSFQSGRVDMKKDDDRSTSYNNMFSALHIED